MQAWRLTFILAAAFAVLSVVTAPAARAQTSSSGLSSADAATLAWLRDEFADVRAWLGYADATPRPHAEAACDDALHDDVIAALHAAGIPLARSSWLALALRDALAGVARAA